jgi:ferredoxin
VKILVDQATCREYANCVIESPDVFDLDEITGKVVALLDDAPADLHVEVRAAAASCPVHAITLVE